MRAAWLGLLGVLATTPVFAASMSSLNRVTCTESRAATRQAYEHDEYAVAPSISHLMLAAISGKTATVRAGLAVMPPSKARYWRLEAMDAAAYFDRPAVVVALLDDGADPNAPIPAVPFKPATLSNAGAASSSGMAPNPVRAALPAIFGAIDCHEPTMVRLLLRHGANPNYQYKGVNPIYQHGGSPYTPLMFAVVDEDAPIVKTLLDAGADACVVDRGFINAERKLNQPVIPNGLVHAAQHAGVLPPALVQRLVCHTYSSAR